MTLHPQYITDNSGNKISVILSMKEYRSILEDLQELEDIRQYDETKKNDDGSRIKIDDYIKKRKTKSA
jgi:hypothetical protein